MGKDFNFRFSFSFKFSFLFLIFWRDLICKNDLFPQSLVSVHFINISIYFESLEYHHSNSHRNFLLFSETHISKELFSSTLEIYNNNVFHNFRVKDAFININTPVTQSKSDVLWPKICLLINKKVLYICNSSPPWEIFIFLLGVFLYFSWECYII